MKIEKINTNKISRIKRSILNSVFMCYLLLSFTSCNDFLDVVPDNIANLDHVFATRETAENYLATLYSHIPSVNLVSNILWIGADDTWTFYDNHYSYQSPWKMARGEQSANSPYVNAWDGENHMNNMFLGIRECNTFLEEIQKPDRVPNLSPDLRKRWIAEANFLKAYFHFYLFRMYGPIPITDVNIPVSASPEVIRVKRDPVDKVVEYIAGLLDKAAVDLPLVIQDAALEEGRVTKGAALTLKAKLLVTAASDLFNGNPDYANFKDKDGINLFSLEKDQKKWSDAVDACEEALEALPGKKLYFFTESNVDISETTRYQMNLRGAITDKYNEEIIWVRPTDPGSIDEIQIRMLPPSLDNRKKQDNPYFSSYVSPTLAIVERFYTKNGVPLEEDKEWDAKWGYTARFKTSVAGTDQAYNVQEGYTTARINMDREHRFYGSLAFDGALIYMKNVTSGSDKNAFPVKARYAQPNGIVGGASQYISVTGYYVTKLTNWNFTQNDTDPKATMGNNWYAWPEFRLADLYLLYAEALNEEDRRTEAIKYLDLIRDRSGLKGIEESWSRYSNRPNKFNSKDGLREIIQQEREIELAFEGQRIWDTRRWKKAADYQNRNVQGWNVYGRTPEDYYKKTNLFDQRFVTPRDYFWPISTYSLHRNLNLVQNPGW